ncbi:MAG: hypothetical protein WKF74_02955 [Pyrinomonadaceae bacterium]
MKKSQLTGLIAVFLLLTVSSFAQQTDEQNTVSKCGSLTATTLLLNGANQVDVPEGEGMWTVQIITSGGILGNGKGDLALTSKGNFSQSLNSLMESKLLTSETLQPLAQLIAKAKIPEQVKPFIGLASQTSSTSLCSDCYKTTFILSRREADGKIKTLVATWDATTKTQVAEEVLQIYESIQNLTAVKDKRTT